METNGIETGVVLTFKNGRKIRTSLSAPFRPEENVVRVFVSPSEKRIIPLDQLCCVSTAGSHASDLEHRPDGTLEEVELITGERFAMRVTPGQVFNNGFFGISADESAPLEKLFVVSSAVRVPGQGRLAVDQAKKAAVFEKEVISGVDGKTGTARDSRSPEKEQQMVNSHQREQLSHLPHQNARLGDILIDEGLVTREQVENVLEMGQKNKLGSVLIERGLISEEQLLKALAAKFGSRFVDLSEITPSPEALAALSKNIVNQMQVLPLDLQGKKLIVATSEESSSAWK
jgi:hypothetical protein